MNKNMFFVVGVWLLTACNTSVDLPVTSSESDLVFSDLAKSWDEGMPLGNATVGSLVWQRDSALRLSLDRTDLWDLRPMDSIAGPNNRFAWVREQVMKGDYLPVNKKYDWPYDREPAPSKIPGAALEFSLEEIGEPSNVRLYLNNALCEATWDNGATLKTFVHAEEPIGWFVFENLPSEVTPTLIPPKYNAGKKEDSRNVVEGQDLIRLGYEQGKVEEDGNHATYRQKGWNGFYYDVDVRWSQKGKTLCGVWSVTSSLAKDNASEKTEAAMQRGVKTDYKAHMDFWNNYWAQSSVTLPEAVLQKQYDNDMYKFGSTTREHSYPISLQAVWTADNGKLPSWKGDYHHDLNTQLSYWPTYTGNHLKEGLGFLNTLWNQMDVYKKYTRTYFETEGMNVPGVCTLVGEPMGGWIQYAMSQTAGAWLTQHFYLHWKYSLDREFLKDRAYPFIKEVATFLEQISVVDDKGVRKLTMSSSPEKNENSIKAWFMDMTNYDLALMKFTFSAASELAAELKLQDESAHWKAVGEQLPELAVDKDGSLSIAVDYPYNQSHRHLSHAMAIHPLGLLDWSQGEKAQNIIRATIKKIDDFGPAYWTGYTYTWLGNMKARAFDGEGAAEDLRILAECFCLPNTFHVNGDQSKSGKSTYTYRPFTLEGNFAFAAGIQEMLLQSHTGIVRVFPAIPADWSDVSFRGLRAMGAFLVSAEKKGGEVSCVRIYPEQGGTLRIASPFGSDEATVTGNAGSVTRDGDVLTFETRAGEWVEITRKP